MLGFKPLLGQRFSLTGGAGGMAAASPEDARAACASLLLLSPTLPLQVTRTADSTSFLPKTSLETAHAASRHGRSPAPALAPSYVGCATLPQGCGAHPSPCPSTAPSPPLPHRHGDADLHPGLSGPVTTCYWLSCPASPARWPAAPSHRG